MFLSSLQNKNHFCEQIYGFQGTVAKGGGDERTVVKKIPEKEGLAGLKQFLAAGERVDQGTKIIVCRYLLELVEARYPGQSVELRIPPAGAVQILSGVCHRRGTPPAVVEMGMVDWINLACGTISWESLMATARVHRSGERSDIGSLFPLLAPAEIACEK